MKLDELPELPFLKVLSYLSLQDRLMLRSVSRSCQEKVAIRVTSLCFSEKPRRYIPERNRWLRGVFAENLIISTRFALFFDTFGQTMLSNIRHLRLWELYLCERGRAAFIPTLNSLRQLEQLDMVEVHCRPPRRSEINLPMLTGIHFEYLYASRKLTLNTPRLRNVEFRNNDYGKYYDSGYGYLKVEIVHGESVERLITDDLKYMEVMNLKNLKYLKLLTDYFPTPDSTFLSSLEQLKEIHVEDKWIASELFEQKQRYGRADLKIYLNKRLMNGPDDPAKNAN